MHTKRSAADGPFGRAFVRESTPVPLVSTGSGITTGRWLPSLIESLEVEDIKAPVECSADALLVERLCVVGAGFGRSVVVATCSKLSAYLSSMYTKRIRTVSGPPGLSVPDLNRVDRSREFLDVTNGLHKIIKVGGSRVVNILALPVCKGVHKSGDIQPGRFSPQTESC